MKLIHISKSAAAVILGSIIMTGCGSDSTTTTTPAATSDKVTMSFAAIDYSKTDAEKAMPRASSKVTINGKDIAMSYNVLLRTNDVLPKLGGTAGQTETIGLVKDIKGNPVKATDGSNFICRTSSSGSGPDHTTLLQNGGNLFSITQFECSPGAMYITQLSQDKATGALKAVASRSIDQSSDFGGYVHCAGVATPWGSHLSSEEYEPNAKFFDPSTGLVKDNGFGDAQYFNTTGLYFGDQKLSNPYYYGWIPEVTITSAAGDTKYAKHYTMGRVAHELAYVMPDNKTAYLSDDGANTGFFMFIADKEKDLSSGTLYAAKWVQKSADNGGSADINWISLGSATDAEIKAIVTAKPKFTDMFDEQAKAADGSVGTGTGKCGTGFTSINTSWGHECLAVKAGMDKAASRLETRRYAAIKGATTEFNKEEGITFDPDHSKLYMSMSYVQRGMEDNGNKGAPSTKFDIGGNNDIKLPQNLCGTVFALDIAAGKKDSAGNAINSSYVVGNMYGLISGKAVDYSADPALGYKYGTATSTFNTQMLPGSSAIGSEDNPGAIANKCDINGIASPDNLTYLPKSNILIIGEDTQEHQNDNMWAYDVEQKTLTRIFTTPYGSETTSPFWYPNINGFGYMTGVIQHPFGESDVSKATNTHDLDSYIGYFGPFPALSK